MRQLRKSTLISCANFINQELYGQPLIILLRRHFCHCAPPPIPFTVAAAQRLGEAGDREIRRRAAIDDRRDDAGRHEGEGCQQADVPFALVFTLSNLGKGGNSPEPDVVDPSSGLSDGTPFLNVVPVRFSIAESEGSYYIPLRITPWTYTVYRGQ